MLTAASPPLLAAPPPRRGRTSRVLLALTAPILASILTGCPEGLTLGDKDSGATHAPFVVDAITPDRGYTTGGTRVTIRGGPFESNVGVLFGAHASIDPVIVNSQMITAVAPPQAAGLVDVRVLANGGQITVLGAFTYEDPPPEAVVEVDSVFPATGLAAGGTVVTIIGANFTPEAVVLFGALAASDVAVLDSQTLVATTPAFEAGAVDVTVQIDGSKDILARGFEYVEPTPRIDSIEPASGPVEGGTQVTIRGAFLPADAGVLFGASAATSVTFVNEQIVTAIAPAGAAAGVVDIALVSEVGQLVLPGAYEYLAGGPVIDDGTDTDGDGLTDVQEQTGWETWIESFGLQLGTDTFGNVNRYVVTSDPTLVDTDGDGLSDELEMLIKSDPRKVDSDEDGLQDGEEWNQWLTSPTSVDTDADARGDRNLQNAPNQALFDGMEMFDAAVLRLPYDNPLRVIRARATSPTLFDTDGDGVSDYDEYDSTVRNGVLADLPRLEYELVGDVDVRLNVEYAESAGQTKEYGTTLTESQSETIGSEFSSTIGWSVEIGAEFGYAGASVHVLGHINAGVHGEYTSTYSTESSKESSRESSRLQSDSLEFTETAADGAIRTAILLKNAGNTTFTVSGLGVLVSQREKEKPPGDTSQQMLRKTIATMTPVFETFTLAPGETAGPFELAATGVNAQSIKELLAAPDMLMLETAAMNFTDSGGLDYDFVRQFTVAQTAYIVIDLGDGEVRHYNIATNVDRNPDSSYRGITLRRALEEVLRLPFGDADGGYTTMPNPDPSNDLQVLDSLLGRRYAQRDGGRDNWTLITNNPAHTSVDFNDTVLRAGDYVHLMFSRDDDNDGLSNTLEKAAGTDLDPLSPADADGDGLTDRFEVLEGWIAFEDPANPDAAHPDGFQQRRVLSDPRSPDADEDGLTDAQEFAARSDPSDPDTDGDSLIDGQDPFPIRRAGIRFVKADANAGGNGRTWDSAYLTLQQALADAGAGQATPAFPDDDVAQIWVARGDYKPSSRVSPIELLNNVGIYGGFSGPGPSFEGEAKRGQRNTNAFSNGCIITGDLLGDDTGAINLDTPGTYAENCRVVISAPAGLNSSALLDGFMITGAYGLRFEVGGALSVQGSPTIQNCLITRNARQDSGGGIYASGASAAQFKKCILAGNLALRGGGAFSESTGKLVFEDCEFAQNESRCLAAVNADDPSASGGGALISSGRADFNRCVFSGNRTWNRGGGICGTGNGTYVRVDSCRFYGNLTTTTGWLGEWRGTGAGMSLDADASISNSVFWDNRAESRGAGIAVIRGNDGWNGPTRRCTITNCTIAANRSGEDQGGDGCAGGILTAGNSSNIRLENTIVQGNYFGDGEIPDLEDLVEGQQIYDWNYQSTWVVSNSCLSAGWPYIWSGRNNNINTDGSFVGLDLGDLRVNPESPCIDRGNTFVDLDPLVPGLQQLPQFDLFGNLRVIDGNRDGIISVDIGAFEAQPQ